MVEASLPFSVFVQRYRDDPVESYLYAAFAMTGLQEIDQRVCQPLITLVFEAKNQGAQVRIIRTVGPSKVKGLEIGAAA